MQKNRKFVEACKDGDLAAVQSLIDANCDLNAFVNINYQKVSYIQL